LVLDFVALRYKNLKTRNNSQNYTIVTPAFTKKKILGGAMPVSRPFPIGVCGTRVHFVLHTFSPFWKQRMHR